MSQHRRTGSAVTTLLIAGLLLLAPALTPSALAAPTAPLSPAAPAAPSVPSAPSAPSVPSAPEDPAALVADTTACAQPALGYAPRGACELRVLRAQSACVGGAPVLEYAVEPVGTPRTTVTLTWQNPTGPDVVFPDLPLSGTVLWPGTVVEGGTVLDWPGWTPRPDGGFDRGDEYDWVRPGVSVLFEVNPTATQTVSYPSESARCANPATGTGVLGGDEPVITPVGTGAQPSVAAPPAGGSTVTVAEPSAADRTALRSAGRSQVAEARELALTGAEVAPELRTVGVLVGGGLLVLVAARLVARRRDRTR